MEIYLALDRLVCSSVSLLSVVVFHVLIWEVGHTSSELLNICIDALIVR